MSLLDLFYAVAWLLVALIPLTIVSLVFVVFRNGAVLAVSGLARLVAWPVGLLMTALALFSRALSASEIRQRAGLAYRVHKDDSAHPYGSSYSGWDLAGPAVYFLCFLLLAAAEFPIAALRLGALVGFEGDALVLSGGWLQALSGVLFTVTITVWGFVAFDFLGWSPLRRPFAQRPWVRVACFVCFALSVFTGMLLVLWGQLQVEGESASALGYILIALFGFLLFGATALSAWSALPIVIVVTTCAVVFIRWVAQLILAACGMVVRLLDATSALVCAVIDLLGALGRTVWNWLVRIVPERFKLHAAPDLIERPRLLDAEDLSPLPATSLGVMAGAAASPTDDPPLELSPADEPVDLYDEDPGPNGEARDLVRPS